MKYWITKRNGRWFLWGFHMEIVIMDLVIMIILGIVYACSK